jgi:hypothetical protein
VLVIGEEKNVMGVMLVNPDAGNGEIKNGNEVMLKNPRACNEVIKKCYSSNKILPESGFIRYYQLPDPRVITTFRIHQILPTSVFISYYLITSPVFIHAFILPSPDS